MDDTNALRQRTPADVAQRVLALLAVVGMVHDPERTKAWMEAHSIETLLSPDETALVRDVAPTQELRVAFSWRAEALVSLLWTLGALPEMPPLSEEFDVFGATGVKRAVEDPAAFVSGARLRSAKEIEAMESHLYHQHWRVRDAEMVGLGKFLEPEPYDPPIDDLHPDIVMERRYGLSWVAGWGESWDEVPTDT